MNVVEKYKNEVSILDYSFDWTAWLLPGDFISVSSWFIEPIDSLFASATGFTSTITTVWLSGGQGSVQSFRIRNLIQTDGGRVDQREFVLNMID